MGLNIAARAATSDELTAFRSAGGSTKRYLAIQTPQEVFRCRINQAFTTLDSVASFEFDDDTGDITDVLESMTAYVSAVGFDAHEKGMVRVRKSPTADTFYIAETSGLQFADGDYITVVDLMPPALRALRMKGGLTYVDYDMPYGYVASSPPVPVLGPIAAVITLVPDGLGYVPFEFTPPDPSLSYSPEGTAIESFLYSCPDASAIADEDTTEPIITIDTPGIYRFSCLVTDELGRSATGHRWIFANPPNPFYTAEDPQGDAESGNFYFGVECLDDTTLDDIPERAMCVMYEIAYYDGQPLPLGPIEGYENIKAVGWIENESITRDPESGRVRFRVQGPAFWISQASAVPFELTDTPVNATSWTKIKEMTVDRGLAHTLTWFSNLTQIMDCRLTGDAKRVRSLPAPDGSLWDQLRSLSQSLFAVPMVNQLGQLFIEINQQYILDATRDALPVVMTLAKADIVRGSLTIENVTIPPRSFVELAGTGPYNGVKSPPLYSRAPGTAPKAYGSPDSPSAYLFDDQDDCNFKAGCVLAVANNKYQLSFALAHNNNLISICPRQYLQISIAAGDTPRGIVLTNARIIPRSITPRRNAETGEIQTVVTCEVEAIGIDGITYYPPQPPQSNLITGFEDYGFDDFPALDTSFPGLVPPPLELPDCTEDVPNGAYTLKWSKGVLLGNTVSDAGRTSEAYFPCTLRPDSFVNESRIVPNIRLFNGALGNTTLTAFKDGADVLSIDIEGGIISGISEVAIDGFRVVLAYDPFGNPLVRMFSEEWPNFVWGSKVTDSGPFADEALIEGLTPGNWYVMQGNQGILIDASPAWLLDGQGPQGEWTGPGVIADTIFDGHQYFVSSRMMPSFASSDGVGGVHFQDYALYFLALKSSYVISLLDTPSFGAFEVDVYNVTFDEPRTVILSDSQLFNVCAS